MNTSEKIALIGTRFLHRKDVFAYQTYDEKKGLSYFIARDGRCSHVPPCEKGSCLSVSNVPISAPVIKSHLNGTITIAVFQLSAENDVSWMCLDVDLIKGEDDTDEMRARVEEHTITLAKKLVSLFGKGSFLVEQSGSKGYHLWVFFDKPVQAFYVLSLGRWIDESNQPPEGISVEVFPKQTTSRNLGSMVKLPLGIHKRTNNRCFFVNSSFDVLEDQWGSLASVRTITEKELLQVIQREKIEIVPTIRVDTTDGSTFGALPCMTRMMTEGLHEGIRDRGMLFLASWSKRRGIPHDVANTMMRRVNEKTKPPLSLWDLDKKVESAYHHDYSEFPCNLQEFDCFCSSRCRFFASKARERKGSGTISRD